MPKISRRRRSLRFRPFVDLGGDRVALLERRLLLSVSPAMTSHVPHQVGHVVPMAHPAARSQQSHKASHRVSPAQEINKQYSLFYANFQLAEAAYVRSFSQQAGSLVPVTTTLTANYPSGSVTMQVADAGIFGPQGLFPTPVAATAQVGSVPVATFSLTGSSGNLLTVDPTQSSAVSLGAGTTLTAQVSTSASSSAAAVFPSYITTSAQQLATNLVAYFNSLPIKLPRMYAPPHQSQRAGALQQYVYQLVAGGGPVSLEQTLLAVSLPQTPGSDLQLYDATVQAAIQGSKTQMFSGVQQIFANKLPVIPINSSGSTSGTSTGSSSGTTGTGSTTTGGA